MYALRVESFQAPGVVTGRSIRVAPSRPRIDAREPTLGFHITTDQPFVELIVATSAELFAAAAASRRTAANYYASREQGLARGPGNVVIMLPAAVVSAMVSATPPARQLYYLAVGYGDDHGSDPTFSIPRERWASDLPFVEVEAGLDRQTIANALGMAIEQLRRAPPIPQPTGGAFGGGVALDTQPTEWRWETRGTITPVRAAALEELDDSDGEEGHDHEDEDVDVQAQGSDDELDDDDIDYDDGFGEPTLSHGHGRAFAPDDAEPAELPDDEALPYGDEAEMASYLAVTQPQAISVEQQNVIIDAIASPVTANGASLYEKVSVDGSDITWGVLRWKRSSGGLRRVAERAAQAALPVYDRLLRPHLAMLAPGETAPTQEVLTALAAAGGELKDVQRALARTELLAPLMGPASDLGIASMRGLAILGAVALAVGLEDALTWTLAGIGPAPTEITLRAALTALGVADLATFQRQQGLPETGALDARTHARLACALRALGDRSPAPVRSGAQALSALVRHAAAEQRGFAAKLESLMQNTELEERDR